jgi:hypothetical protein
VRRLGTDHEDRRQAVQPMPPEEAQERAVSLREGEVLVGLSHVRRGTHEADPGDRDRRAERAGAEVLHLAERPPAGAQVHEGRDRGRRGDPVHAPERLGVSVRVCKGCREEFTPRPRRTFRGRKQIFCSINCGRVFRRRTPTGRAAEARYAKNKRDAVLGRVCDWCRRHDSECRWSTNKRFCERCHRKQFKINRRPRPRRQYTEPTACLRCREPNVFNPRLHKCKK